MIDNTKLNINEDEQIFLSEAKQLLNFESEHLQMTTLMSLERARKKAIQQPAYEANINNHGTMALAKYWPSSIVVMSMLLLLTFFTLQRETVQIDSSLGIYSDLELLSSLQPLDFYENLEFYQWLEMDEKN